MSTKCLIFILVAFVCGTSEVTADEYDRDVVLKFFAEVTGQTAVWEGDALAMVAKIDIGNGNVVVGKYIDRWRKMYIPYFGKEFEYSTGFKVIRFNQDRYWAYYPGYVPWNAIQGGKEGTAKLYIGRKWQDGKWLIGKIVEGTNSIYCPYFGKEIRFDGDFDILVAS